MRFFIIRIGNVEGKILDFIQRGVEEAFYGVICEFLEGILQLPEEAYNPLRRQYISEPLLSKISKYALRIEEKVRETSVVLGVTDVDLYTRGMNFIFGEAQCPGKAAVISLFRLRPEFYGEEPNEQLFIERAIKEAIHELGHTVGLRHCRNPLCVMHFSLHIGMTDEKNPRFCEKCAEELRYKFIIP